MSDPATGTPAGRNDFRFRTFGLFLSPDDIRDSPTGVFAHWCESRGPDPQSDSRQSRRWKLHRSSICRITHELR